MASAFNAHRPRRRPSINITSLIDVMFLLLIFFMVSSTFRHHFGIDVALPQAETATEQEVESTEVTVTREGDFYFGEQKVDAQGLRRAIRELVQRQPDAPLVLRADEQAAFGAVAQAIDIARDEGGTRLVLPTRYRGVTAPDDEPVD